jgi:hypothetical protein
MSLNLECPGCRGRQFVCIGVTRRDDEVLCSTCGSLWTYGILEDIAADNVRQQLIRSFPGFGLPFGEAANDGAHSDAISH